jgi:hypothetical protein
MNIMQQWGFQVREGDPFLLPCLILCFPRRLPCCLVAFWSFGVLAEGAPSGVWPVRDFREMIVLCSILVYWLESITTKGGRNVFILAS